MKRVILTVAALALGLAVAPAIGAGLWYGLPAIGGGTYCVGYSVFPGSATSGGTTLPTPNNCNALAPAGPALFQGTSVVPVDIYGPGATAVAPNTYPTSVYVGLNQLGQGRYVSQGASAGTAAANTIPDNVSWMLIGAPAQGSAFTITMPPNPVEGQIQHIVCGVTTGGTMTVAANTSVVTQVLIGNPNGVCTAGVGYKWRYAAATLTWYRF